MAEKEFDGGVLCERLAGGRSGARIYVRGQSLRAVTPEGEVFDLAYANLEMELGGASGRMLFCRDPSRTVTIFCEQRGFIFALTSHAGQHVQRIMAPVHGQLREMRLKRLGVFSLAFVIFAALFWGVPAVVRWSLNEAVARVPYSVDERLGAAAIESIDLGGPRLHEPRVQRAVDAIVARLGAHTGAKEPHFQVRVIRSNVVNAFALPGGYLVVYTGLLERASRAEEIAGVLAHEMAHVVRRHGMQRIAQSLGIVATVHFLFGDIGGILALGKELLSVAAVNNYSRAAERDADADAVRTLHDANLDPLAIAEFFKVLQNDDKNGAELIPEWASTHPDLNARISAVTDTIRAMPITRAQPLDVDWAAVQAELRGEDKKAHAN